MKLAISNIAWEQKDLDEHLALLADLGCDGVELAPSAVWGEPASVTDDEAAHLKHAIDRHGLQVPAFHALLFTRPDLHLFGDTDLRNQTVAYVKQLIRLAGRLSCKALIYGSPRSRSVNGKSYERCYASAVETFSALAAEALVHDTCLCIEPLGPSECDFIRTADEGYQLVRDVASPGFALHLDAKAMAEAGDDFPSAFRKCAPVLRHFHVNDPGLAPPGSTGLDHAAIGEALAQSGYQGFVSIEMRKGFGDTRAVVRQAVAYVRQTYFAGQ